MQTTFLLNVLVVLPSSHVGGVSNIGEIFEHESAARSDVLHNAFGENVVTIPVESLLLLAQLFQVTFSRLCSFGLQFAAETKRAAVYFFPVASAEEVTLRSDSRMVDAQINTYYVTGLDYPGFRNADNDMQPELSLPVTQISRGDRIANVFGTVVRHSKGESETSRTSRESYLLLLPTERVGLFIIPNWTGLRLRHLDRLEDRNRFSLLLGFGDLLWVSCLFLGFPGQGGLHCLGRLDTGLDEQVGDQARTSCFGLIVGGMMQLHAILFVMLPTKGAHRIESHSELPQRLFERLSLLWCGMQLYS